MFEGFFLDNGDPQFGITTPRYSGNAVQRNRVKRIMREIYRNNRQFFPENGIIMYVLKKCAERDVIEPEMIRLSLSIQAKAKRIKEHFDPTAQSGNSDKGTV